MIIKVLLVAAISAYLCLWCAFRERKRAVLDSFAATAFLIYIYLVLAITVLRQPAAALPSARLVPFYSYYLIATKGWHYMSLYVAEEVLGNVLLFTPLGIIVSQLIKRKTNWCFALIIGAIVSLAIEFYQFKSGIGTFEIDDIIHNCLGAVFGCLAGNSVVLITKGKKKKAALLCLPVLIFIFVIGACSLISIFFR